MRLVKSKQRVADHGEVFTPAWMVEALVSDLPMTGEAAAARSIDQAVPFKLQSMPSAPPEIDVQGL